MRKDELATCTTLLNELKTLVDNNMLGDSISPEELMSLLSPEARTQWTELLDVFEPSPVAKAAGYTNVEALYYALQKELITRDAGSEEEAILRLSIYEQLAMLGHGKEIDQYDQSVRKVRCISRGFRHDLKDIWDKLSNVADAITEKLKNDNFTCPEACREDVLSYIMDEPEAEQLVIGETYTLIATFPDFPLRDDMGSGLTLVFLDEIHSAPKDYIGVYDGGFHSHLFEELEEVSLADRIRHHDEYMKALNKIEIEEE